MPGHRCRRPVVGFIVCLVAALFVTPVPGVAIAPGTWGAGAYPYLDGVICTAPNGTTSPLAAWDVGTGRPAYLLAPLTSDGVTDSAVPPLAIEGGQNTTPVVAGTDGFSSAADIATYAALLSEGGPADALATAVLTKAGTSPPACGASAAALLSAAAATAGPYTVALAVVPSSARIGAAATVTATVHGGTGGPAQGVTVNFVGGGITPQPASAVTDAAGHASTSFLAPTGLQSVGIAASVTAPVGLQQVTVASSPSPTNPSGASVPAIYPADPVTVTAQGTVPIDLTAHPSVTAAGSVRGITLGNSFAPHAQLSGMNGHSGQLDFTVYGPAAADAGGGCAQAKLGADSPVAATTGAVPVTGDQAVGATAWQPPKPGCYLVVAHVVTTDAQPQVQARSSLTAAAARVAVIDAVMTLALPHTVEGAGGLTAAVTATGIKPASVTAAAALDGPLAPADSGSCAAIDWSKAPQAPAAAAVTGPGAGPLTITSSAVGRPGCYRWRPQATVTLGDGASVVVPVPVATVLVLTPTLALTLGRVWTNSPDTVPATITVTGLYRQHAHVEVRLTRVAMPATGCAAADFSGAQHLPVAAPVAAPVPSAGSVDVVMVPTPLIGAAGCYRAVPVLLVDANPGLRVSGAATPDNTISAADPAAATAVRDVSRPDRGFRARLLICAAIAVLVELIVAVLIAVRAWLRRDAVPATPLPESLVALVTAALE